MRLYRDSAIKETSWMPAEAATAVTVRIRIGWKVFSATLDIADTHGEDEKDSKERCTLYTVPCNKARISSSTIYGSESWPVQADCEKKLDRAEMRMVRRMCEISLHNRYPNTELRKGLDLEPVNEMVRRSRLRWYGHVYRKNEDDWGKRVWKKIRQEEEEGSDRQRKTWDVVLSSRTSIGGRSRQAEMEKIHKKSSISIQDQMTLNADAVVDDAFFIFMKIY